MVATRNQAGYSGGLSEVSMQLIVHFDMELETIVAEAIAIAESLSVWAVAAAIAGVAVVYLLLKILFTPSIPSIVFDEPSGTLKSPKVYNLSLLPETDHFTNQPIVLPYFLQTSFLLVERVVAPRKQPRAPYHATTLALGSFLATPQL